MSPTCNGFISHCFKKQLPTYGWPSVDTCSTKRSFNQHVNIFLSNVKSGVKVPEAVLADVEERLRVLRFTAAHENCPIDYYVEKMFDISLVEIDLGSVPGHCEMSRFGSVNSVCLGYDYRTQTFDQDRIGVFKQIVKQKMRLLETQLISDPLRVFIKKEPHKIEKIEQGRFRLISAVSLVDAMIDRVLFRRLKRKISDNYSATGMMIGWTPLGGGYRYVANLFMGEKIKLMADRSSWDWTYPEWLAKACLDIILMLAVESPRWWRSVVVNRFKCLFWKARFKFDDGEEINQREPGIMKSGCYLTIVLNSLSQIIIHRMAKGDTAFERPFICLGDDTLQSDEDDEYLDNIRRLGFVLKVSREEEIEFAGFRLFNDRFIPAYGDKHLFRLMHLPMDDKETLRTTLENYQVLYYFVDYMSELLRKIILKTEWVMIRLI